MYPSLGQAEGTEVVPDLAESWTSDEAGGVFASRDIVAALTRSAGEPATR